ncbi:hypothetical protein [Streptomyces sp. XY66]|uniref:hypothetical protein n=1 Tax=Streptomyces sp. XY66 TaxID=1415563 RepID=UPI00099B3720|nr:hypothetical protein [Streptomyces sp. XY66]
MGRRQPLRPNPHFALRALRRAPPPPPPPATPAEPSPVPVPVQRIPVWAKTTALLAPTVGGGIGAASIGLAYAAPGLIALTEALWAAVALIAAGGAALFLGRARRTPGSTHITQHITATGLFGRATGSTVHHR